MGVRFVPMVGDERFGGCTVGVVKSVLRLYGGTTDELVRGEVGLFE